jgi:hypothetical protein
MAWCGPEAGASAMGNRESIETTEGKEAIGLGRLWLQGMRRRCG